jgi:hypothetical protein
LPVTIAEWADFESHFAASLIEHAQTVDTYPRDLQTCDAAPADAWDALYTPG